MSETMLKPDSQGKVRDIYDLGDTLLIVATDRLSAFDYILNDEIPYKGEILTRISRFWFERFAEIVPDHMVSCDVSELPAQFAPYADYLRGRSMIVRKAEPIRVECIVRGYLTGSSKKAYDACGEVNGIALPAGLTEASKLPEPIFTPSTKADVGVHDENITYDQLVDLLGAEVAARLRDLSLKIYTLGADYAATRGIIVADTKFEFGYIDGEISLIDECLTPDSSRLWPASTWQPGHTQPSYDKQLVRDWLKANWDFTGEPPQLPADIIEKTSERYREVFSILTGSDFVPEGVCS